MSEEGFDIGLLARNMRARNAELEEMARKQRVEAKAEGIRIAREIKKSDGEVKTVWGFGSTFDDSRKYRLDSDIDLAIEGGDIIKAWLLADRSKFKVDVVDISESDQFGEMVKQYGQKLTE